MSFKIICRINLTGSDVDNDFPSLAVVSTASPSKELLHPRQCILQNKGIARSRPPGLCQVKGILNAGLLSSRSSSSPPFPAHWDGDHLEPRAAGCQGGCLVLREWALDLATISLTYPVCVLCPSLPPDIPLGPELPLLDAQDWRLLPRAPRRYPPCSPSGAYLSHSLHPQLQVSAM